MRASYTPAHYIPVGGARAARSRHHFPLSIHARDRDRAHAHSLSCARDTAGRARATTTPPRLGV
jgi:hypothetical protein